MTIFTRYIKVLLLTMSVCITLYSPSIAKAAGAEVGAEILLASKYVWRGIEVNEEFVAQPSLTVSYEGFSFNVWGNMDLTNFGKDECVYTADCESRSGQFTEIDLTLDYSHNFDKLTLGAGIISYQFPNWDASEDTHELYASIAYDCLFQPTFTLYYDFDEVEGFYANLGVSHSFSINEKVAIDLSGSLGYGDSDYNEAYFGVNGGGFVDAAGTIGLPIQITKQLTVTPILSYSSLIDSEIRDNTADKQCCNNDDNIYGGIALSFSF